MTKTTSKHSGKARNAAPKSRQRNTVRSIARKAISPRMKLPRAAASTPIATNNKKRPDTKQARVIAMLRAPAGTTIEAMMRTTGWQQHSVRGFLAGIVRKKLGLNLLSRDGDSGRVYRIKDRTDSSTANPKTNRAA